MWSLRDVSLVFAVPTANALNFLFTFATAYFLGEHQINVFVVLGSLLILAGTALCVMAS